MRSFAVALVLAQAAATPCRGAEDPAVVELRQQIDQAIADNRPEDLDNLVEIAVRTASAANKPALLGRLELFGCELEAEHPTAKTVVKARKALLHLAGEAEVAYAAVRLHTSTAMVALATSRLGACALHLQEARAAIASLPAAAAWSGSAAPPLGVADPRRDQIRLDHVERSLLARLRAAVDKQRGDLSSLPAGHRAALASFATGQPLRPDATDSEPLPPRIPAAAEGLLGRIDRALAQAEAREIDHADVRGDDQAGAEVRSQHAETLLRLGQRGEALSVRREALGYYRDHGTFAQVLDEARWIAARSGSDRLSTFRGRLEEVREIQHQLGRMAGSRRAEARAVCLPDLVALCEAAVAVAADRDAARAAGLELLEAVDLARERAVWEQARLVADPARWRRLGGTAAEVRKLLDGVARDDQRRDSPSRVALEATARARQRALEALLKGESTEGAPLDSTAIARRVGARTLVIFGRIDDERLAIAALPPGGPPRVSLATLPRSDEEEQVAGLRQALADGGEDWHEFARTLGGELLGPLAGLLGEAAVVIPDELAMALPLAVLEEPGGGLLGERVAITLAPSLSALSAPPGEPITSEAALLFGVSRFAEPSVPPLPSADREVATLLAVLDGQGKKPRQILAAAAAQQLQSDPGRYHAVHITTRVRLDGPTPLLSALLLGSTALPVFELASAPLRTTLLVLDTPASAPESSLSATAAGLGGLAFAALSGAARSVVLGVAPPEGPAAAALLWRLYDHYSAGQSPARALALAQREMASGKIDKALLLHVGANPIADRVRFSHPRYWAGFVVWGDP